MRKHYRIKSKGRFFVFVALCLLIVFGSVTAVFGLPTAHAASADEYTEVVVESGDTLWKIARSYGPANVDTRVVVYNIERVNGISADSLVPGQILLVPVSL